MKKLLLLIFFSGSLDGFSQVHPTTLPGHGNVFQQNHCSHNLPNCKCMKVDVNPDTLRAIILVTLSPNGIAHARMGFVVVQDGKRPVYLDCRKRALKLPQVGWGYVEVGRKL